MEGASTGHGGVGSAVTTAVVAAQMMPTVAPAPSRTAYPTLSGASSVAQSVHSGPALVRAGCTDEELAKGTEKVNRHGWCAGAYHRSKVVGVVRELIRCPRGSSLEESIGRFETQELLVT